MELNLQLDQELEGTFPASDPLKITRFPTQTVELRGQAETRRPMAPRTMTRILRGTPERSRETGDAVEKSQISKKIPENHIKLKRAYEPPASDDGTRILIDQLWPRGVRKADAAIDEWIKEIAPSTELRKWFGHDPERWPEFQHRYKLEIRQHPEQLDRLRALARHGRITLVFSAHDEAHNDAMVLKDLLLGRS